MPGIALPEDFGLPDTSKLVDALRSRKWALDRWEGDAPLWYVRPAATNALDKLTDLSWGGQCVFLTDTGCELAHDDRPAGCRLLEPSPDEKCTAHGASKLDAGEAWEKYDLMSIIRAVPDLEERL